MTQDATGALKTILVNGRSDIIYLIISQIGQYQIPNPSRSNGLRTNPVPAFILGLVKCFIGTFQNRLRRLAFG